MSTTPTVHQPADDPTAESRDRLARWLVVVLLVCTGCALVGLPARATYGARTTADEPQYLLSAISLADDADLDISDELATEAYLPFHEIPVDQQTRPLDDSGRRVSPHDPLLPLLLAGPMALGGWVAAKIALAVMAGATATLAAWVAARRFGVRSRTAAIVTIGCFAGLPLAGYGTQVYPEMPAALALCAAVAATTAPSSVSRRRQLAIGALALVTIVALPWLSIKYVPVALVAGLGLAWRLRHRRHDVAVAVVLAAASGVVYLVVHQWVYGGWTAYASGDHFADAGEFTVVGTQIDIVGRARRIPGLLVDRRFGLAAWSPVWLLLAPAVGAAVRRGRRRELFLLALVGVAWLNATFVALTMHGWWVPGRQLVVALPIAAVLVARWVDRSPGRIVLAAAAGVVGLVNWAWLAIEASTGRRTLVVDFFDTSAPGFRLVGPILPDGIRSNSVDSALLAGWAVIIVVLAVAGRQRSQPATVRGTPSERRSLTEVAGG